MPMNGDREYPTVAGEGMDKSAHFHAVSTTPRISPIDEVMGAIHSYVMTVGGYIAAQQQGDTLTAERHARNTAVVKDRLKAALRRYVEYER